MAFGSRDSWSHRLSHFYARALGYSAFALHAILLAASLLTLPSTEVRAQTLETPKIAKAGSSAGSAGKTVSAVRPSLSLARAPLAFEPNRGQATPADRFLAHGPGYLMRLESNRAVMEFDEPTANTKAYIVNKPLTPLGAPKALSMALMNANRDPEMAGESQLQGTASYFSGRDPKDWIIGLPTYARVNYKAVYPGIDLSFYGKENRLEYDFLLRPRADAAKIEFAFEGAESVRVDGLGNLVLRVGNRDVRFLKPVAYQVSKSNGQRHPVDVSYRLKDRGGRLGFSIGAYDHGEKLVIDPVLDYGTYLTALPGSIGYSNAYVNGIAVDASGNTYLVAQGGSDNNLYYGFSVLKFDPNGNLLSSGTINTDAAGGGVAVPTAIAVSSTGAVYVSGYAAIGLPTTANAFQAANPNGNTSGNYNAFLAVFQPNGSTSAPALVPSYISYLGGVGPSYDLPHSIAVDAHGSAYIAGETGGEPFPTTAGAYQTAYLSNGGTAEFIAKFDPTKTGVASLVYSTLLGTTSDYLYGIAVDSSGSAYVTGSAYPADIPSTTGAFAYSGIGGGPGINVTKLNPAGSALVYSAYLGPGTGSSIAVDGSGDAYLTGVAYSPDFPTTPGAYQTSYPGAFATELNAAGTALVYSTFLGGPSGATNYNLTTPASIALPPACASACAAYISGLTTQTDFPTINAIQSRGGASQTGFVVELAGNGASAIYSTYLGGVTAGTSGASLYNMGAGNGNIPGIGVDSAGNAYTAGNLTGTLDFPVTPSPAEPAQAIQSVYLAKIGPATAANVIAAPTLVVFPNQGVINVSSTVYPGGTPVTATLLNTGSKPVSLTSIVVSPANEFAETDNCNSTIAAGSLCTLTLKFTPESAGTRTGTISVTSTASATPVVIALSGTGVAQPFLQWSPASLSFPDTVAGTSSATQTATLTNLGHTPVTGLGSFGYNPGTATTFPFVTNCPSQLDPGNSCQVSIQFAPPAVGLATASIYAQGVYNNPYLPLSGTGIASGAGGNGTSVVSPVSTNLGSVAVGNSTSGTIYFTNTSAAVPVTVNSISVALVGNAGSVNDFSITGCQVGNGNGNLNVPPFQENAGTDCAFTVNFTPSAIGTETATITVTDSSANSPHAVTVSGVGLAATQAVEFVPSNQVFLDQPLGYQSAYQTFNVYNTGTAPLTIDRAVVSGDFQITQDQCSGKTLAPPTAPGVNLNVGCMINVAFTPTALGARSGTLTLIAGGTPQVLNLMGNGIAATGTIVLTPNLLTFPAQPVGLTSVVQTVTLTNPGNTPVAVNSLSTTGDFAATSQNCGALPYTLSLGSACSFSVTFTPTSSTANPRTGTLTFNTGAGNYTAALSGTGEIATQTVGFTPTAISFGSIPVGTTSDTYSAIIRNTGTEAVTFNAASTINGTGFAVSSDGCTGVGITLPAGTDCTIYLTFTPTATGAVAGSLTFSDSAGTGTQTLSLSGTGIAVSTVVDIDVDAANFPLRAINTISSAVEVNLHNYGSSEVVNIVSASITGGGQNFSILQNNGNCIGDAVQPGGECYVYVQFNPTAAGYLTGTITFVDTAGTKYAGALAGYSPAAMNSATVSPANLGLGSQVVGTTGSGQYVYLSNTGNESFTLGTIGGTNFSTTGPSATAEFSVNSGSCSATTLNPGDLCNLYIQFTPTAVGARSGTVNFPVTYSGAASAVNLTATLTGTGVAIKNEAIVSPGITIFPDQVVGTTSSSDQIVYLNNTGNLPLTMGTVTGTNYSAAGISAGADFSADTVTYNYADGCSNQSVAANSSCAIRLQFTPTTSGSRAGTLVFPVTYSGAANAVNLTATLSGKGIADTTGVIITPNTAVFSSQVVGTTGNYTTTQTIQVRNTGNRPINLGTVTGTNYSASGPSATAEFSSSSPGYDGCSNQAISPGTACSIALAFTPVAAGTRTGSVIFPVTLPGATSAVNYTAMLSGVGIAIGNSATLSPTSIQFPDQLVGTTLSSEGYIVYLTNTGNVPLSIGAVVGTNYSATGPSATAEFSAYADQCSSNFTSQIAPQQSCAVYLNFTPNAAGNRTGTLVLPVTYAGAANPVNFTAQLSGTGVATNSTLVLSQPSVAFGNQAVGTTSSQVQVTLTNYSANSLPITSIVLGGANPSDFTESDSCGGASGSTISAGGSCTIYLNFTPSLTSLGARTAKIIETDPGTGGSRTITLTGTGTADLSTVTFYPASTAFATTETVSQGTPGKVVSLNFQGSVPLNVTSVMSTDPADFPVVQDGCSGQAVASGGSCDLEIAFTPTKTGALSAMIKVADSASGSPQTFIVTGGGTAAMTSTTTLAATPASAAFGSLFTLVATVKNGTNPVANGSVTFYNGTRAIGTVQVVTTASGGGTIGTATLKTLYLPVGANSITAKYTGANASSVSTATTVTVTGKYPSAAVLAASGVQGSYVLTGTVEGAGPASLLPTSKFTFTDNQTNTLLGTVSLDPTTVAQTFVNSSTPSLGSDYEQAIAMADVNGDGKQDLIVGGYSTTAFSVLLGNGDGTFGAPIAIPGINGEANNIVVGDLNGDGRLDVVISNGSAAAVFLGNGDGTFQGEVDYDTGVSSVAIGDFNGDGILDLVTTQSGNPGFIDLLPGNGDGTFQDPVSNYAGNVNGGIAVGDLNGDGKLDVITGGYNVITVLLGNGNGTFQTAKTSQTVTYDVNTLAVADLNGDGKLDLVTGEPGYNNQYTVVYIGNGDGTFQGGNAVVNGGYNPAIADVNGDGKLDLVVGQDNASGVGVVLGNGDGTFQSAVFYATGNYPRAAALADINNDGKLDIATVNYNDGTVTVLLNTVTQTAKLTGVTLPGVSMDNVTGAYSGDANFSGATSNTLSLASNPPPGTTVLSATPSTGAEGTLFTLLGEAFTVGGAHINTGSIDFYDNGSLLGSVVIDTATGVATFETRSLAIGAHKLTAMFAGTDTNLASTSPAVSVTVTGKYATTTALSATGVQGSYALTATVNGFGLGSPSGNVVFTDNSTNTTLGTLPLTAAALTTNFLPPATPTLATGNYPFWVVTGDFNGDGKPDIAVANQNDNTVSVYLGNGDGTFRAQQTSGYAAGVYSMVAGDFNGDGKLDLAVATTNNAGQGFVGILIGNGDGTFLPTVFYSVNAGNNPYPESIFAADLNGDGKLDLVVGNRQGDVGMVSVLLGNGDGTFGAASSFGPNLYGAGGVTVGDFNGDGKPDIAVSANGASGSLKVAVFLGNGDGTFGAETDFSTGNSNGNALSIVSGDFNLDAKLDLAVATDAGTVSVLSGNGDGTFSAAQSYSVGGEPNQLVIADVNGDGNPDLVFSDFQVYYHNGQAGANFVSVLLGSGTAGSFQPVQNFNVAAAGTVSVAVADFNGDGRPDIVSTQYSSNELSILLGSATESLTLTGVTLPGSGTGTDNVTAAYSGDTVFGASASNTLTLPSKPLATTTALSATPTTGALGSVFTLTATVKDANSNAVTGGTVSFYNGTTLLSTVQLVSATGTATYSTASLPLGAGSLKATFNATDIDATSASASQAVTVTGKYPTTTTLTSSGSVGNYSLSATVNAAAPFTPTGNVVFSDTTTNTMLGTLPLSAASPISTFTAASSPYTGGDPQGIATGDFNGDGVPDIVVASDSSNEVNVYISNGDGTVKSGVTYPVGSGPVSVAVVDLNGDGKLDLAVVNGGDNTLDILLGNGDGTFQPAVSFAASSGSGAVAAGDFNGDGKADLAVVNYYAATVSIFLGNGNGTVQVRQDFPVGSLPAALHVGDFNRDGKLDLAVANSGSNTVSILLGNGDGTLQPQVAYATEARPLDVEVGDFNGDGKLDLATANNTGSTVSILLGNGDGTFAAQKGYPAGADTYGLAIGDVNGDGIADIVTANGISPNVTLLLGNGDGTFQTAQGFDFSRYSQQAVLADFNRDGRLDIATINSLSDTVSILLGSANESVTLTGVTVPGTGTHNVVATYAGDPNFAMSTSSAVQLAATPASSAITLAAQPSASVAYGQPLSVLVTVTGQAGTNTPTGNISYTINGGTSQTAALVSGAVSLNLSGLAVGGYSLVVNYAGDQIHAPASAATLALTITKASQTITFNPIANTTYGSGTFGIFAVSTSGLPVAVKVVSGPATVLGDAVTITGAGTVVLEADQAGNASYNAATAVQQSFTVAKAALAVVVNNATKVYGTANPTFTSMINGLVGNDTVTVNYTTTATITSSYGTYPINATISGPAAANYTPTITAGTLTITKTVLTVTVNPATRQYGAANPVFTGTIAGLQGTDTATAAYSTTAIATSPVGTSYSITATVTGSNLDNYMVTVVPGTLTITPASLTITVTNAVKTYGTANPAFTSTFTGVLNGDSIPVTYSTSATTTTGVGSYTVTASTTDANYTATIVPGTLTINPAPLTILVNSFTKVYGSANPTLTGTVNGLLFSDTVTTTYATTALQSSSVGAYSITASISGGASANYTANVTPGTLTITQAVLTATAADQTRYYSLPNPTLTYTITGFVNGDTAAVVSGTAVLTTTATPSSPIGPYPITFATETLAATNYSFLYAPGTLHVSGNAPQTITFSPLPSLTYGAAPVTLTATASSGLPVSYTVSGPATLSGSALTITGVGQVTVTASQAGNVDFAAATAVSQSFSVAKAALTVTATSVSRQYDTPNPALTYTVTGFVSTDTLASAVTGTATLTTTATLTSQQGGYPITFVTEALTAANYTFTYVAGTLTVTGGTPQTIAFAPLPDTTYGAAPITLTATASSGLPVSYAVTGPVTLSGSILTITGAGPVSVTASQAGNVNFAAATSVQHTFMVAKAALTVTAANASRLYGAANPAFTYAVTGFVNNETVAVLGGSATLTTTATSTSAPGGYPITFATEALTSSNYSFTYVSGTLTVTTTAAATPTFSIASGLYTTGTGIYTAPQYITISDTTPGATIYYTLNGTAPTVNSTVYTSPVYIGTNETLEAAAIATGYTLSGTASATYTFVPVTVSPTTLAFGNQSVLAQSPAKTLNVTNPGANVINGFTTSITGANPSDFAVISTGCNGLVNGLCSLNVAFTPQSSGARSATLNLSYAGTGSPVNVTLTGIGTALTTAITLTPSSGSLTYGQSLSVAAALSGTPNPTGAIAYSLDGGAAQSAALSGGSASIALGVIAAGSHTLAVNYAGDAVYGSASQSLNFTVAKARLTATADSLSRQYLAANPALTYSIAGFVNGDTTSVVSGTATLTTAATSTSASGTYPITFATEGLTASNYSFTYVPGILTVLGGKPQTITFGTLPNVVYGVSPITLSATASSGLSVTYTVTGPATVSGSTLTITGAGSINVTAVQAGDNNYSAAPSISQGFTVAKAVLTVTAASLSRQYLAANPALTYTTAGFVSGDSSSVVSGSATLTTTATSTSAAGTYPITFATEGLIASNYTFNYVAGTLTVGPNAQTITFGPISGTTYGTSPIALTATASSGLAVSYTVTGPAVVSGSTLSITGAGMVTVTASQAGNVDYNAASPVSQNFMVAKAVLTATAANVSRRYNAANPALTYTTNGFVNGDTVAVVSGTATLTTTATTTSMPGTYPITFATEGLTAANYTFNYVPGTLTVGNIPTITFLPLSNVTYGASPITLGATASDGLPVSYTVTGPATVSGSTLSIIGAGMVTVTASQAGNATYPAAASVSQNFSVSKASLTVSAASAMRAYGAANPAFTYTTGGFVNGDGIAVVSGTATLTTSATTASAPGMYPITFATEGLTAANYTFNYVAGALTIGPATQTITFGTLPNLTYGASPITLTATASSGLPVIYTVTGPATISSSTLTVTGAGSVVVTASQTGNADYSAATSVSQTFTVTKAVLTATAANLMRPYGAANPALTYVVTGFVNSETSSVVSGTATLTTTATLTSPAGPYPITFATEGLAATNYTFTYVSGTLTVGTQVPTITFAPLPNTTYGAAPITLTATASDGLPVSYTVSGPATISGSVLKITGAGQVTVTASQAGSANYSAATSVSPDLHRDEGHPDGNGGKRLAAGRNS